MCIKMLLNNPNEENKAIKAIEKCQGLAMEEGCNYEDPESGESVFDWLSLANDLYDKTDHEDFTNFQPLKDFDCTDKEGWV